MRQCILVLFVAISINHIQALSTEMISFNQASFETCPKCRAEKRRLAEENREKKRKMIEGEEEGI